MEKVIGYGLASEVVKRLEDAGMTFDIAKEIVGSRGNKKAKTMMGSLNGQEASTPKIVAEKEIFVLFKELGTMTVPRDYVHETRLADFHAKYQNEEIQSFYYYNEGLTDANFARPSRIIKAGDRFKAEAWRQTVSRTTYQQRLDFAKKEKSLLVGAQGGSLVWEHLRDAMPKGYWYSFLDEKNRLPTLGGDLRVPYVYAFVDGGFDFDLDFFQDECVDREVVVLLRDCAA